MEQDRIFGSLQGVEVFAEGSILIVSDGDLHSGEVFQRGLPKLHDPVLRMKGHLCFPQGTGGPLEKLLRFFGTTYCTDALRVAVAHGRGFGFAADGAYSWCVAGRIGPGVSGSFISLHAADPAGGCLGTAAIGPDMDHAVSASQHRNGQQRQRKAKPTVLFSDFLFYRRGPGGDRRRFAQIDAVLSVHRIAPFWQWSFL